MMDKKASVKMTYLGTNMEFIPRKIGLKVKTPTSMAKCISILRKYNPVSISEIKTAIESNEYVLSCMYTNDSDIRKIRKCYDELSKSGILAVKPRVQLLLQITEPVPSTKLELLMLGRFQIRSISLTKMLS